VDVLYLLVPLSIVLVFAIGAVFWWALGNGQFDDLEGPAHRVLMDDDAPRPGPGRHGESSRGHASPPPVSAPRTDATRVRRF